MSGIWEEVKQCGDKCKEQSDFQSLLPWNGELEEIAQQW
jgi:hypothetical protein